MWPPPEGLSDTEWLEFANVDVPEHCFKGRLAVPWLSRIAERDRLAAGLVARGLLREAAAAHPAALAELEAGRKEGHWVWWV